MVGAVSTARPRVGVLALQGAFREHRRCLEACGAEVGEVRVPAELDGIAGLVIPGGESTTIGKLLLEWKIMEPLRERALAGMPIWGTCAGMILLCKTIADSEQTRLGLLDATVRRNAFGRQRESFEADLSLAPCGPAFAASPFRAVFIRAPLIERVETGVSVLARAYKPGEEEGEGRIVMARQGGLLATSFHPELTGDLRVHQYFLDMVAERQGQPS